MACWGSKEVPGMNKAEMQNFLHLFTESVLEPELASQGLLGS